MEAAVYCRISHVLDDSTIGVDRQEQDGTDLVKRKGWTLAAVHVDNNRSAWKRNRKRPGWDALLTDIRERRVGVVVVAHPDRLIRQPRDLEDLLDLARDTGVQLVSAGGNRDLSNPDDVFILRIEVAHACRSSDDTSRRVARGHLAAAEQGLPGGGTGRYRAYGYAADQMTVMPDEAQVVRECARRIIDGQTWGSVVTDLNARGVPTVGGGPWSRTSLRSTLTSPRTAGLREHKGKVVGEAAWPAILSSAERDLLLGRVGPAVPGSNNRRKYLLSGLARCECGGRMKYRTGPASYGCPDCGTRAALIHVERIVIAEILRVINTPALLAGLNVDDDDPDQDLHERIAENARRIDRIYDTWESGGQADDWARRKVGQIEADSDKVRAELASRERRSGLAGLAGIDEAGFRDLPLIVQRSVVAELLPDLTVMRVKARGKWFDESRVRVRG